MPFDNFFLKNAQCQSIFRFLYSDENRSTAEQFSWLLKKNLFYWHRPQKFLQQKSASFCYKNMFVLFKNQSSLLTFQRKFWNLTLNQLCFRMVPAALVFWILQTTKGSSINSKMKENFGKMAETCACAIWVAIPWFPVLPTIFWILKKK